MKSIIRINLKCIFNFNNLKENILLYLKKLYISYSFNHRFLKLGISGQVFRIPNCLV